jgi:hypothetical protein
MLIPLPVQLLTVTLLAGCSDYQINPGNDFEDTVPTNETSILDTATQTTTVTTPVEKEEPPYAITVDETDPPGPFIELPPLKKEYCTPFDTFEDWSFIGDGNWTVNGGQLYENRGGLYGSVAYLSDETFKDSQRWTIEVSTAFEGSLNDMAGIVFNIDASTRDYMMVRWDDPNHAYQRHSPPGSVDVMSCFDKECAVIRSYTNDNLFHPADGTFVTWSMHVMDDMVTVIWNGSVIGQDSFPGLLKDSGPGTVGLYSNDNDGGIIYDDFCVYTSKP